MIIKSLIFNTVFHSISCLCLIYTKSLVMFHCHIYHVCHLGALCTFSNKIFEIHVCVAALSSLFDILLIAIHNYVRIWREKKYKTYKTFLSKFLLPMHSQCVNLLYQYGMQCPALWKHCLAILTLL